MARKRRRKVSSLHSANRIPVRFPFRAVAGLLRKQQGLTRELRAAIKSPPMDCASGFPDADLEDLVLFDDLLGITDPNTPAEDRACARRRRLTALMNAVVGERRAGGLCR